MPMSRTSRASVSHHYRWTFDHLDARLANSAAFALHQRKSYKAAAEGFAKAAAADPSWAIPAYNLASARTLMGDLDGAIGALSSRLASDPIVTYMHVSSDAELRPLLARKELIALRAKTPGTTKLAADAFDGGLAYAPERGLVAVLHEEHSWGSSAFGATVEVYDIKSSKLVASTEVVQWSETDPDCYSKGCKLQASARAAIGDRVTKVQAMLRELGFSPIAVETATVDDGPPRKAYLSTAKLGVASADGVARVLRGNTVLATAFRTSRASRKSHVCRVAPPVRAVVVPRDRRRLRRLPGKCSDHADDHAVGRIRSAVSLIAAERRRI